MLIDLSDKEVEWIKSDLATASVSLAIEESESRSKGEKDFYIKAQIFCATFLKRIDEMGSSDAEEEGYRSRDVRLPSGNCGEAINQIWTGEDGRMWVGNGEYSTQVSFDPVTGEKAKNQTDETEGQHKNYRRIE